MDNVNLSGTETVTYMSFIAKNLQICNEIYFSFIESVLKEMSI